MNATIWGFDLATAQALQKAYALSRPPEIQALLAKRATPNLAVPPLTYVDGPELYFEAQQLGKQGLLVDGEIDGYGTLVIAAMTERLNSGYAWWVNIMQPVPGSPVGYSDPNVRPPGALKVSINPADFPPFNPPVVTPAPPASVIGPAFGGSYQLPGPDGALHDVYSCAAQVHFTQWTVAEDASGAKYWYDLLGSPAVDLLERIGVWLKQ